MHDATPRFSRWDVLNPINWLSGILFFGWVLGVYYKPHAAEHLPTYARFDDIVPWAAWGWVALVIVLLLQLSPRVSWTRVLGLFLCTVYMFALASTVAWGIGYSSGVGVYGVFTVVSAVMFARSTARANAETWWWRQLVEHPPRWLRRLAQVEEYDRSERGGKHGS